MGFVDNLLYPVLSVLSYLYFFAILLEIVAFGINAGKGGWVWNDNMDLLAYMVKILSWTIPRPIFLHPDVKKMVGAGTTDLAGIYRMLHILYDIATWQDLLLNKVGLLAGDMIGWVSALDGKGKPLLGYAVSDGEGNEFEIGSRVKAAKGNNVALMSDMLGIGKNALFYGAGFGKNLNIEKTDCRKRGATGCMHFQAPSASFVGVYRPLQSARGFTSWGISFPKTEEGASASWPAA